MNWQRVVSFYRPFCSSACLETISHAAWSRTILAKAVGASHSVAKIYANYHRDVIEKDVILFDCQQEARCREL
jgi:hypothetical protein